MAWSLGAVQDLGVACGAELGAPHTGDEVCACHGGMFVSQCDRVGGPLGGDWIRGGHEGEAPVIGPVPSSDKTPGLTEEGGSLSSDASLQSRVRLPSQPRLWCHHSSPCPQRWCRRAGFMCINHTKR